jgi:opacity protein-like surface antigen
MNGQSRGKFRGAAAMLLALGMSVAPHAAAQPAGAGSPDAGKFYAFGGFALFGPDKNDQLQGERGGLGVIGGGGFRFTPLLSFELGVLGTGHKLDTPASASAQLPVGTFKDGTVRTNMSTGGLNLSVKFHFTLDRIEPYFGGGVGRYTTSFRTTSEASTCERHCADTGPRVTARSSDTGYHAVIGVDYHVTQKNVVGVEFRQLWLDANFDDIGLGKVKAGGSLLWLGYRRYF